MLILDTNVLSEMMRPAPHPAVVRWIAARPVGALFTTAVTQGETLLGLALMSAGRRQAELTRAVETIFKQLFRDRVLPFDSAAARSFGTIGGERRRQGRPIATADAQIAAIAHAHGATLITRNVDDFTGVGVEIINPWAVT